MVVKTYTKLENKFLPLIHKSKDPQHGIEHIQNVMQNALSIADLIDPKQKIIDRNLLKACVLSHDLTYSQHNHSFYTWLYEGKLVVKIVQNIIHDIMEDDEKLILLDAIERHIHSFPIRRLNKKASLYAQILQDADTLDLFNKKRVENFANNKLPKIFKSKLISLANKLDNYVYIFLNLPESNSIAKKLLQ